MINSLPKMRLANRLKVLVLSGMLLPGCTSIQSAGTYLGDQVGIVPDKKSYTPQEQEQQATALISNEQEYHIGRAVAARILSRFKQVPNPALQHYLQLVGNALVVDGEPAGTFGGYHFMVIQSDQMNALAAPGGYIFITSAFLKSLHSEGQLASILSHEIAHVSKRHGIRLLQSNGELNQINLEGLKTGGLGCTEALAQATALFARLVDSLVDTLLESGYSQDLEFEADAYGLEILLKAGYSPQSAAGALEVLKQVGGKKSGGWFSTHPSADARLSHLNVGASSSSAPEGNAAQTARFNKARGAH